MVRYCNLEKGNDKGIDESKNFLWKELVKKNGEFQCIEKGK
jgi:hypothetical protein